MLIRLLNVFESLQYHNAKYIVPLIFFVMSLLMHFYHLSRPTQYVWDECFHVRMAHSYLTKEIIPDIHPPSGKFFIYAGARLAGFRSPLPEKINSDGTVRTKYYNIDNRLDAFRFRWFPALCGSLVAPFIWFIILQVTSSKLAAGFGASLALLDTALLYQTRIAVLEPFLLPAVLTSIFFFSLLVKKPRIRWLVLSALTAGMCFAVKWTGLSLIGWGLLIVFSLRKKLPVPCKVAIPSYLLLAFLPYIFFFGIYYAMVPEKNVSYAKRFINDHVWIMNKNAKVSKTRKDSSKFYKWPLGIKPIKAISKKYNHKQIYRYFILIANPVVWIMCIIMIPFALVYSVMSYVRVREVSFSGWLVILYFMNWIPYALIKRAMFLYHYLPALLVAIILTGIMVSHFQMKTRKVVVSIIIVFSIFYFWLNYPLATGRPITNDKIKQLLRYNPSYYRLNRWMKIRTPSRL